eukprot:TRINITY_DN5753_c0_g1_i1.p1 TRINITY_DN5753_c0_g1~~TRINITY_DN5753_c0_g1_i1.p1  ORF type:complete len:336 (+),score=94.56 TRINITY_DN5753_c0_g1_i1:65-1009(+)
MPPAGSGDADQLPETIRSETIRSETIRGRPRVSSTASSPSRCVPEQLQGSPAREPPDGDLGPAPHIVPDPAVGMLSLPPLPSCYDFVSDEVALETDAAKQLLDLVRVSLPHARMLHVRRFGNRRLWHDYCHRKRAVAVDNDGCPNVRLLFHGTRSPTLILGDPLTANSGGFDFRLSEPGAYGRGAYFATHAAYPVLIHPRRQNPDGSFTCIVAEVALGSVYDARDRVVRDLSRPPERRQGLLHNSVRGTERGIGGRVGDSYTGEQFVVYDRDQAYPHFAVTISLGDRPGVRCPGPAPAPRSTSTKQPPPAPQRR